MRTFVYIVRPRSKRGSQTSQLHAGVVAHFQPEVLRTGSPVDVAEVDVSTLDETEWAILSQRMLRMPGYQLLSDPPELARMPKPAPSEGGALPPVPVAAPAVARVDVPQEATEQARLAAIVNGWPATHLIGTGDDGRVGIEGGHSPITGLTLAEMALSVPPASWSSGSASIYPWEDPTWVRPPGFKPRSAPTKASTEPLPDTRLVQPIDVPPPDDVPGDVPSLEAPAPAAAAEVTDGAIPALESLAAPEVLALIRSLLAEDSEPPSLRKVNFRLAEAGLKKLTGVQLTAILAAIASPTA